MSKLLKGLVILQILTTILSLLIIYLIIYPSFFYFAFPSNYASNIIFLFLITPLVFENFYLFSSLKKKEEEFFSLFKQRLYFETLIKVTFIIIMMISAPHITITQVKIYYLFLLSLLIDIIKFTLLLLIMKKEREF